MIDRYPKIECNGCKACAYICPRNAIVYDEDDYGFWYPRVDYVLCIKCGKCISRCPNKNPIDNQRRYPSVKAAWSKDDSVRLGSTSGGLFYELAREALMHDGVVVGCVYDDDFKGAHHVAIDSLDELPPLMVSKYVESDTEGIFPATKNALELGKEVLFVGSPCQCAGLQSYLGRRYENLLVADFICRGTNSPKAHRKYVEYLEHEYGGKITRLRSKDKRNGWEQFGQAATFDNGAEYYAHKSKDLRVVAYHYGNLMVRESCADCKFKTLPRFADLTLGDFWGIKREEVEDIDKGVSLCFINSKVGEKMMEQIKDRIVVVEKTLEEAKRGNPAIYRSTPYSPNRELFLGNLDNAPFDELVAKYRTKPPTVIKRGMGKIKALLRRGNYG